MSLLVRNGDALAMRPGLSGDWAACAESFGTDQYANRIGIELTINVIETFERFEDEFGVDPQFRQHGYLILQQTEEERRLYTESAATQRPTLSMLRPPEAKPAANIAARGSVKVSSALRRRRSSAWFRSSPATPSWPRPTGSSANSWTK